MPRIARGLARGRDGLIRCWWAGNGEGPYPPYHDREWGFPVRDDRRLFEKISLEGFQSGLSWLTILRKRENFRRAFRGFEPGAVARLGTRDVERLLQDPGIVRHRGKIESTVNNARQAVALQEEFGSLARYFWSWAPQRSARPRRVTYAALLALKTSPEALALSRDLKRRGWTFVGPTTVYSFMQAMGLVNDHLQGCVVRNRVEQARARFRSPGG